MKEFTCGLSNRSIDGLREYSSLIFPVPTSVFPLSNEQVCCVNVGGGESSVQ